MPPSCGLLSTASFICRACAWRLARRDEVEPAFSDLYHPFWRGFLGVSDGFSAVQSLAPERLPQPLRIFCRRAVTGPGDEKTDERSASVGHIIDDEAAAMVWQSLIPRSGDEKAWLQKQLPQAGTVDPD